jgi:hypothetical protein
MQKNLQSNLEPGKVIGKIRGARYVTSVDAKTENSYRYSLPEKPSIPTTRVARVDLAPRAPDR